MLSLSESTLYTILKRLEDAKMISVWTKEFEGRLRKFYEETVLEEQAFIKDSELTVKAYLEKNDSKLVKLVKYEVGEGMEKRNDDFAAEVMNQIK